MPPESPTLVGALDAAHAAGLAAHRAVPVDRTAFAVSVPRRVRAFLAALGGAASPEVPDDRVASAIRRAAAPDLYLAVACEGRVPGAWESLQAMLLPPLEGAARRRGARDPEAAIQDVLGSLTLPASGTDPRPLLDAYAGQGSLAGFATVLLVRRLARDARSPWMRRRRTLDAARPDGGEEQRNAEPADPRPCDPADRATREEAACRFAGALDRGLAALTARERLVIVLKHRDGLPQQEIARAMGIGAPRISRLLHAAVERLQALLPEGAWRDDPEGLAALLSGRLAIRGASVAPPGESRAAGGAM